MEGKRAIFFGTMADSTAELVQRLERADYYGILGVDPKAQLGDLKRAFYRIAAHFHPDRYEGIEENECAHRTRVFKLAVEAYTILSRPDSRASYDELRAAGHKRMDAVAAFEQARAPKTRTLEDIAQGKDAKAHAKQADFYWAKNELEDARASLVSACRFDPQNKELRQRLDQLYRALED